MSNVIFVMISVEDFFLIKKTLLLSALNALAKQRLLLEEMM